MECFLCNSLRENPNFIEKREEIKTFSKEIFLSCKTFLSARKHHSHKYADVVLPDSWNEDLIGYHSSCYKEFRVKSKYLTESDNTSTGIEASCTQLFEDHTPEKTENLCHTVEVDIMDCSASVQSFTNESNAKICFFCEKIQIHRKSRQIYCRQIKNKIPFLEKVKMYATELGDTDMLLKIQEKINCIDDTCLSYHNNCNVQYFSKYKRKLNPPLTNEWALKRDCYKNARERLIRYIQREIIENRRIISLAYLKNCFSEFLREMYEKSDLDANIFSTQALKDYMQSQLKNRISFINISNKPFVMSAEVDIETVDGLIFLMMK